MSSLLSALGRLFKKTDEPDRETTTAQTTPAAPPGIHPGLTDQQLVALLTAAAYEVVGNPVRIKMFRPLTAKDYNWVAQGRSELQYHRLK